MDQEAMKIGLGAHTGTEAEISESKFPEFLLMRIIIMLILGFIIIGVCCMVVIFIAQKYCSTEINVEEEQLERLKEEQALSLNEEMKQVAQSSERKRRDTKTDRQGLIKKMF
mmetsp:Transcript_7416/g.12529  ORF Transcript_7416/g.12529 Transcript_7416/m.12529 type:complete len:112 (+) Transcript_7416:1406-1741(+)